MRLPKSSIIPKAGVGKTHAVYASDVGGDSGRKEPPPLTNILQSTDVQNLSAMLTIDDAILLGNIGRTSLYAAAAKGLFPIKKFGTKSLIPRDKFIAFLNALPDADIGKGGA